MTLLLYTAELDLADEHIEPFLQWYAFRHAPDLFPIGFLSCTCYRATEGDMSLLDIYEVPGPDIFDDPRYLQMGPKDPYATEILAKRRNKAHTVYAQRSIMPAEPPKGASLDADWVSVLRFDASDLIMGEVAQALEEQTHALLSQGARRVRLCTRTTDHPRYTTFRPHGMILVEWAVRPPEDAHLSRRIGERFGSALSNQNSFVGYRLYPWPDRVPEEP